MIIAAGQFKAKCMELMDLVNKNNEEIIISKHGKPVAKLVPLNNGHEKSIFGYLKNSVTMEKDIVKSTGVHWNAEK